MSGVAEPADGRVSSTPIHPLRVTRMGIRTHQEAIVYMRTDCHVCGSEGFFAQARVLLSFDTKEVVATLHQVESDLLGEHQVGLSEIAWARLGVAEDDEIHVSHAPAVASLASVRSRIYGHRIASAAFPAIISDIVKGQYSDVHLASFITACAALPLDKTETVALEISRSTPSAQFAA